MNADQIDTLYDSFSNQQKSHVDLNIKVHTLSSQYEQNELKIDELKHKISVLNKENESLAQGTISNRSTKVSLDKEFSALQLCRNDMILTIQTMDNKIKSILECSQKEEEDLQLELDNLRNHQRKTNSLLENICNEDILQRLAYTIMQKTTS